jgi:glycosyltransferase involved in cell wall biosynthesis
MVISANLPADPFAAVVHVDLGAPDARLIQRYQGRRALFIFWSDERPIAQLWVDRDDDVAISVQAMLAKLAILAAPPARMPTPSSVSVVICTRDRPDELARCLASLPQQSRPPDEVIVVDNASQGDATRQAALAAGVLYVREDRPGLDIARNTGLRAATSEIVAYTDDDTELHPRCLERLSAAFDDEDIMAVTGLVLPARLDTEAQWVFEEQWSFGRGFERIDFDQAFYRSSRSAGCPAWKVGAGANMAFRRSIFDLIGLFDERLDVGAAGCSGDSEYWYRVLAAGWTCRYEPAAVVFHHHRLEMDGLESQIFHYMRGHVAALMVQYERTGDLGNLRRAFLTMPYGYMRRAAGRLLKGRNNGNRLLGHQVSGAIAGLAYYLRAPRPPSA